MKNEYLDNFNKKECNGCGLCVIGCPTNAIKMVEDNEGFLYPQIDEEKCIKCNKCKNICSNYNDSNGNEQAYVAINKNEDELKKSASGGIFFILAKYIIEKKGIVFGVEYGENLKVQHNCYDNLEDCKKFQGSKYVRSDVNNSYKKVKEFLEDNRYVLFTGTPCQCNALKTYLKKDYENLIVCDIICHANPSQKVFDKYKSEIERKYKKKITDIKFRDKDNGWKSSIPNIYFEDGEKIQEKTFYSAFVSELFDRPSCHSCKFSCSNRITDFTIGDFWGIDKVMPEIEDNNTGISLLTVNSLKAKKIFEEIKGFMQFKNIEKEKAFMYNHNKNLNPHKNREKFFKNLDSISIIDNIRISLGMTFFGKVKNKLKKVLIFIKK